MSNVRDEANDFLMGSGIKAFPFESIGDSVTGVITDLKKQQQTDMQTNEPVFWPNGDPKMMLRVTIQTNLRESENDEGLRSIYLRGGNYTAVKGNGSSSLTAVRDAVTKSGSPNGIEIGGTLTMTFTGEGKAANKGFNPPKLYTAKYEPYAAAIDLDEMA